MLGSSRSGIKLSSIAVYLVRLRADDLVLPYLHSIVIPSGSCHMYVPASPPMSILVPQAT